MTEYQSSKNIIEFGDFQTPDELAVQVVQRLQQLGVNPASIIEPTCGQGNLLIAAMDIYKNVDSVLGADINREHLDKLSHKISAWGSHKNVTVLHTDFFHTAWSKLLSELPEPLLVLGNPPWVTSSELSSLQSTNLPQKSNFHLRNGLDAITGKSNFDISEWIILQTLSWLHGKIGVVAMLCKTAVARKVLLSAWKHQVPVASAQIFQINARKHFGVSVDACLLRIELGKGTSNRTCQLYENLTDISPSRELAFQDNIVVSDLKAYQQFYQLLDKDEHYTWRSGIKHDCAKVMELCKSGDSFTNGYGFITQLEDSFVYPLLKSSDVGNGRIHNNHRYMLVTQKYTGEETNKLQSIAPNVWDYLKLNRQKFDDRRSSIYKGRPSFAIFGVGDYTFSPWKVAISGFYKRLNFLVVPPIQGKPVVFDDTIYFLACATEDEARFICHLLNSLPAQKLLNSMIFWEDKRPITIDLLKRLSLRRLAQLLGDESEYLRFVMAKGLPSYSAEITQLRLFE